MNPTDIVAYAGFATAVLGLIIVLASSATSHRIQAASFEHDDFMLLHQALREEVRDLREEVRVLHKEKADLISVVGDLRQGNEAQRLVELELRREVSEQRQDNERLRAERVYTRRVEIDPEPVP